MQLKKTCQKLTILLSMKNGVTNFTQRFRRCIPPHLNDFANEYYAKAALLKLTLPDVAVMEESTE